MGEPVAPEKLDANDGKPDVPRQDELATLRRLLVGEEQDELVEIKARLERDKLRVESLSEMLPSAIELRTSEDDKLGEALAPTIGDSLQKSIKNNPQPVVDAITPIMGPAIRNAISRAIRSMTESLNTAIEHSFSAQGLKWRLEAARSGKPFGEIVLLHSLIYRIEQIFLIHRKTGLPLQHVAADETVVKDADMVSGMLSAIQDFVHDSFGSASENAPLETIEVGERTVWLEQGQQAILAAVIFGHAPTELRDVLQGVLEEIHAQYGGEMAAFDGNVAALESSRSQLESCLLVQYREKQQEQSKGPASKKGAFVLGFLAIALAAAIGVWAYFSIRNQRIWTGYLERLRAEPGIVVVETERRDGKNFVLGMRDPLAADPAAVLQAEGLDPDTIVSQWKPYQSLEPELVLKRVTQLIDPPAGIHLALREGVLLINGVASHKWIVEAKAALRNAGGVHRIDMAGLVDRDMRRLASDISTLEKQEVYAVAGRAELAADQEDKIDLVATQMLAIIRFAGEINQQVRLTVVGHAVPGETAEVTQQVSQDRANALVDMLIARGVPADRLTAVGAGDDEFAAGNNPTSARRVTFTVNLTER